MSTMSHGRLYWCSSSGNLRFLKGGADSNDIGFSNNFAPTRDLNGKDLAEIFNQTINEF